ncbi:outer membrane beta-barrel protein [Devosia sp.]|uniref:outer membrane beta-barrel protein n=1 Tax=Devosia sp. TaxID=1871048 RepID=UPI002EE72B36
MPTSAAPRRLRLRLGLAAALLAAGAAPALAGEPWPAAATPPLSGTDLDWRLALRGAWIADGAGGRFETLTIPAVTFSRETLRGGYSVSADAEIALGEAGGIRLGALRAGLAGTYRLDALIGLAGRLDLSLSQDDPDAPADPAGTAAAALVGSAAGEVTVSRGFGRFDAVLRASASRSVHGETTRHDGAVIDNSDQDNWTAGAGLRLGYRVTPMVAAFVDGRAGYQLYDVASPTYLVRLDAADYSLRAGLAARWRGVLEAEAAAGVNLRRFAEPGFPDLVTTLYDASLSWRPDETLTLGARVSTAVGAPGPEESGLARVAYSAGADLRYQANARLAVRGSAGWSSASFAGTTRSETGFSAGAGLDYLLNAGTTLTADYAYGATSEDADAAPDIEHRVTFGVTLARPHRAAMTD